MVVTMRLGSGNRGQELVFLKNAVLCLDCEAITGIKGDECPACLGRSLVTLARILGSLRSANLGTRLGSGAFDTTITIELPRIPAQELNDALERVTTAIASTLADDRASIHINVQTTAETSALAKTA